MQSNDPIIPLIAIVGPTAVGKTNLAVTVGPQFDAEIVSADSRQFYRYMEIGTAKPTPAERARAPHHLVNIADPDETVGLAQFLRMARAAIHDITARGKRPFLVGGTGQYVRALLRGWQVPEIPPDPALRERLEQEEAAHPGALWDCLMKLDPDAADFIHPNNTRRIIRALEVTMKGDQTFSELRRREPPPYRVLKIGLTMEREELYARADARVEAMMKAGLLQEVKQLLAQGYGWDLPAMSGLGYAQFRPYLAGEATLDEVVERIKLDTHDFIRRQYTWFSPSAQDIHWLDATQHPADHAIPLIQAFLTGHQQA
jgi:tRNA dimethylallyltransferase